MALESVDVVVVGAGFAGLVAAQDLVASGKSVIVLEARDRVGGRTWNLDIGGGRFVEMGGQWVGPGQDRVLALAEELGIATFATFSDGDHITVLGGDQVRHTGAFPPGMPPATLNAFDAGVSALDDFAASIPLEAPWEARDAVELDQEPFSLWLERTIDDRDAREIIGGVIAGTQATPTHALSTLAVGYQLHSEGSFAALAEVRGGSLDARLHGGTMGLAAAVAREFGTRILLEQPTRRIERTETSVTVFADGVTVNAGHAVLAVPPVCAVRIEFAPELPPARRTLLEGTKPGTVIKVHAIYDEPFWRAEGLSGQGFDADSPVGFCLDNSPPDLSYGALVGFFDGQHAHRYLAATPEERREAALTSFAHWFGDRALRPDFYIDKEWTTEEWTRGCYSGKPTFGVLSSVGSNVREPTGRLHWAGAETAVRWHGYIDGAVESGHRVAQEIVQHE